MTDPDPALLKQQEAEIVHNWMNFLLQDDTVKVVHDLVTQLQKHYQSLLLEMGEVHVKQVEEVNAMAHRDRQAILNQSLAKMERYILVATCFQRKIEFMKFLTDPASPEHEVRDQMPYQALLEKIVLVEKGWLQRAPGVDPYQFPWDRFPFRALCMVTFGDKAQQQPPDPS